MSVKAAKYILPVLAEPKKLEKQVNITKNEEEMGKRGIKET